MTCDDILLVIRKIKHASQIADATHAAAAVLPAPVVLFAERNTRIEILAKLFIARADGQSRATMLEGEKRGCGRKSKERAGT